MTKHVSKPRAFVRATAPVDVRALARCRTKAERDALSALARLRDEAAAEIEKLLGFLDATEPDSDAEYSWDNHPDYNRLGIDEIEGGDSDYEPSHCGINADSGCGDGDDKELDESDREPSLGWPESGIGLGGFDDREMQQHAAMPLTQMVAARKRFNKTISNVSAPIAEWVVR